MNPDRLLTRSLRDSFHGKKITRCLSAAMDAVDPFRAVKRNVVFKDDTLSFGDKIYDLNLLDRVLTIGIGKASIPMTEAVIKHIGNHFTSGVAITKALSLQYTNPNPRLSVIQAAHPIPNEQSLESAQKVIDILKTTTGNDLVIFLISGGGSALMTLPVPGVSLESI